MHNTIKFKPTNAYINLNLPMCTDLLFKNTDHVKWLSMKTVKKHFWNADSKEVLSSLQLKTRNLFKYFFLNQVLDFLLKYWTSEEN